MKVAKFGHVQRQPGRVEPELGDHAAGKPGLDLAQLPLAEAVHRVQNRRGHAVKLLLSRRDCGGYRGPA
jgi:hypothetical protein